MQDQTSNSVPEFRNKIAGWIRQTEIIAINDSAEGDKEPFVLWSSMGSILKKAFDKSRRTL